MSADLWYDNRPDLAGYLEWLGELHEAYVRTFTFGRHIRPRH
jgi:hypothetical protein